MVLDEDALEAMLGQQRRQAEDEPHKDSKQVELTDRTEEFEVYERPGAPATGPGIHAGMRERGPQNGVAPEATDQVLPNAFRDAPQEESSEPEPTRAPEPEPEPSPALQPEPTAAPEPEPTAAPSPEAAPAPEPAMEESEASESEDPEPERPRVWPPLSRNKEAPAQEAVQEAPPEPEQEPTPVPEPVAAPQPIPEPTPEPEAPVQETAPDPADPHSHAHADLDVDGGGVRIAIVQALFNQDITDMMADLAVAKAKKRGAKVTHHLTVPGVYDLPLVTARLLEQDDVDCAVVIGVVVQGETSHDELITHATARTLQQLSLDVDKPIGFGVIGPGMTWKQAEARVANGAHAVDAALAQVEALKTL